MKIKNTIYKNKIKVLIAIHSSYKESCLRIYNPNSQKHLKEAWSWAEAINDWKYKDGCSRTVRTIAITEKDNIYELYKKRKKGFWSNKKLTVLNDDQLYGDIT